MSILKIKDNQGTWVPITCIRGPAGAKGDPGNGDMIANDFSDSTAYTTGEYVIYEGSLYRFTSDHAAGAWDSTDATTVQLAEDVVRDIVVNGISAVSNGVANITVSETQVVNVSGTTPTIVANSNTRYLCGEVSTIDFTPSSSGICDVVFTSGTTAAVLTIPNTVVFPSWFDPTSLETNATYEINVSDGVRGLVMIW